LLSQGIIRLLAAVDTLVVAVYDAALVSLDEASYWR
jgi:hypothetical protein